MERFLYKLFFIIKYIFLTIFEISSNKKKNSKKETIRFDYLDGYRGSLTIVVAISHKISDFHELSDIWKSISGYSLTYGVSGFFMLSAYLLTYRLLKELESAEKITKRKSFSISIIIFKYFIRRFFRIYLVYLLFIFAVKYGPRMISEHNFFKYNAPLFQMIILGNTGLNHLWTIPVEIRYYFFIPVFCLVAHHLCILFQWIFLLLCVIWTIYDQLFNFFGLSVKQLKWDYEGNNYLYIHFSVFFLGSQVALGYFLIRKSESAINFFKIYIVQFSLDYISLLITLIGLNKLWMVYYDSFNFRSKPTIYWASALLLTLVSNPNSLSNFFGSSWILKTVGKYSFSFYLLHTSIGYWFSFIYLPLSPIWIISIYLGLTYIISFFTFYLIENPLIKIANYLCSKLDAILKQYKEKENKKPFDL